MGSEVFPQQSFDPVARNRIPYLTRDGKPQLASLPIALNHVTHEITSHVLRTMFEDIVEVWSRSETMCARKLSLVRHNRLITSDRFGIIGTYADEQFQIRYTARRLRPLRRRALIMARPFLSDIRARNPWVRLRRTFDG